MQYVFLIALLAAAASAASAAAAPDVRAVFYGTWGTEKQCGRAPIKPGGTVLAEPFEIRPGWLRQGRTWCRLNWFPVQPREDGFFTGANAQCGEDAMRSYFLRMELSGNNLMLRWDLLHSDGPLARCPD